MSVLDTVEEYGRAQAEDIREETGTVPTEGFWRVEPPVDQRSRGAVVLVYNPRGQHHRHSIPKRGCTAQTVDILRTGVRSYGFDFDAARKELADRARTRRRKEEEAAQERERELQDKLKASRPAVAAPKKKRKKYPKQEIVECDVHKTYAQALLDDRGDGSLTPRPLTPSNVTRFERIILEELWLPDFWHVDWFGFLINGRHRAHAVVNMDTTVPVNIIFGCDPRLYASFDTPKARTGGDSLHMLDLVPPGVSRDRMSAALKMLDNYKTPGLPLSAWGRTRVENEQLISLVGKYPHIYDAMEMAKAFHTGSKVGRVTYQPAPAIVFCALVKERWPDCGAMLDEFMIGVTLGVNVDEHDPRKALYNFMPKKQPGIRAADYKVGGIRQLALLLKMWNYFCMGRTTKVATWREGEQMPVAVTGAEVTLDA